MHMCNIQTLSSVRTNVEMGILKEYFKYYLQYVVKCYIFLYEPLMEAHLLGSEQIDIVCFVLIWANVF